MSTPVYRHEATVWIAEIPHWISIPGGWVQLSEDEAHVWRHSNRAFIETETEEETDFCAI